MNDELRERAILPVLIPTVAIIVTLIVVLSLSRVLLAAGIAPAVGIASVVALGILFGSAALAAGRRIRTSTIVGLLVVLGLGAVGAGAVAAQLGPFYEREEAEERLVIAVGADNLAFDTETIEMPPQGAVIEFTNSDSQPHNIAIFPSEEELADPLFRGDIISGGESISYEVGPMEPGVYFFHCDVHPNMNGDAVVEEGAGEGAHG